MFNVEYLRIVMCILQSLVFYRRFIYFSLFTFHFSLYFFVNYGANIGNILYLCIRNQKKF